MALDTNVPLTPILVGAVGLTVLGVFLFGSAKKNRLKGTSLSQLTAAETASGKRGYNLDTKSDWLIRWCDTSGKIVYKQHDHGTLENAAYLASGEISTSPKRGYKRWSIVDSKTGRVVVRGTAERETPRIPTPSDESMLYA
jgi:hypothetical protein